MFSDTDDDGMAYKAAAKTLKREEANKAVRQLNERQVAKFLENVAH